MRIPIIRKVLEANEKDAQALRELFAAKGVLVLNLMSSPGAGKTTLLEHTLSTLSGRLRLAVIEGDPQTDNDARRIAATGVKVVQVNTEGGCHLSAAQISAALPELDVDGLDVIFIENVGNLLCPAEFDLGEDHKVTLLSVTEGEDKPEKYPAMFSASSMVLFTKIDLLPYVDFDLERSMGFAKKLNPASEAVSVSTKDGSGLAGWYAWIDNALAAKRAGAKPKA